MSRTKRDIFWKFLQDRAMLVVAVLFIAASAVVLWHNARLSRSLIESTALQDAALYSEAIVAFRTLYTREVVSTVRKQGIEVTHDYQDHQGAIPLPATLSMLLGKEIGEHRSGAETRLYSAYPFPWREETGGLRDDFAKEAWRALRQNPDKPFHQFEDVGGRRALRFATADLMRPSCVQCHNSHTQTPKNDWKEGDVRGVLEVILPMDQVEAQTQAGLQGTLFLMGGMTVIGVGILAVVIGRLRGTSSELEQHVEVLNNREQQIRRINEQLVMARDEALEASRTKSLFLSNMSHELRTPLNAIIGYSEMLEEESEELGLQEAVDDVKQINTAGTHLLAIIDDILDISNIEAGKVELKLQTFPVAEVIDEVVANIEPETKKSENTFTVESGDGLGSMHADITKVRQCLLILLSNACKFTEKGAITIRANRESNDGGDWIRFHVIDTGVGIDAAQLPTLFEPFTQADLSSTRKFGGAGLGLAICRKYCQMMGGEISVDTQPGKGSKFTITIPAQVSDNISEPSLTDSAMEELPDATEEVEA